MSIMLIFILILIHTKKIFQQSFFQPPINVEKSVDINIILWTTSFEFLYFLY